MLLKIELKKLFIKQFGILAILLTIILKLIFSFDIFSPDYGALSSEQQSYFLEFIESYGGKISDEKADKITTLYNEVVKAKQYSESVTLKQINGEFESEEEYREAISKIPDIILKSDAIELLYDKFTRVNEDRENRILIASDAKGITTGTELFAIIIICFFTASVYFYESRLNSLHLVSKNRVRSAVFRLFSLIVFIAAIWVAIFVIELLSLISVLGIENLSYSAAVLERFASTPFKNINVVSMLFLIHITKLVGYLVISAVCLILCRLTNNIILSAFAPFAITFIPIYLFGADNNITFYSVFSLAFGHPYFTGDYVIGGTSSTYKIYEEVPFSLYTILIAAALGLIAVSAILYISKYKGKRVNAKHRMLILPMITALIVSLCACSSQAENQSKVYLSGNYFATGNKDYIFVKNQKISDDKTIIETSISMYDKDMNLIYDNIYKSNFFDRNPVYMLACDECLYLTEYISGGIYEICSIDLRTFENKLIFTPSIEDNKYYFDTLTIWGNNKRINVNGNISLNEDKIYFISGNKIYFVDINDGSLHYVTEDIIINDFVIASDRIFYINKDGEIVMFDNEKHTISTDKRFSEISVYNNSVYCSNSTITVEINPLTLSETKYLDKGGYLGETSDSFLVDGGMTILSRDGKSDKLNINQNATIVNDSIILIENNEVRLWK